MKRSHRLLILELCPFFLLLFGILQTQYLTVVMPSGHFSAFLDKLGVGAFMMSFSLFLPIGLIGIFNRKNANQCRLAITIVSVFNLCVGILVTIGFIYFLIMLFSGKLHV